ncbi:MAG: glucose 1-dehydrogenase [Paracoccus sp. (in: a-proteobacteria)]|nr:glucose 1-dehydrogenase [Paracoccus sp. (in: a-proteobacteria)]
MGTQDWLTSTFGMTGQRVLVTGASRGIGRALALGFAHAGADLIVTGRDGAALTVLCDEIAALGRGAQPVVFDQRDVAATEAALADTGTVDVLVNNAGIEDIRPATEIDEALWDRIVDTNLKGAFFVARAIGQGMVARRRGAIINLASLTSFVGVATAVPYTASKSGVLGMTRALATEWAPHGLRVNAIAPGYFHTGLTDAFYTNPAWVETMTERVPAGRLGRMDDLAGAAVFLASDAARYISGQCLVIDGGYLAAL